MKGSYLKGTLYITDVGNDRAIKWYYRCKKEIVINRFLNGYTIPNEVETGFRQLNAVLVDLNFNSIKRIHIEEK